MQSSTLDPNQSQRRPGSLVPAGSKNATPVSFLRGGIDPADLPTKLYLLRHSSGKAITDTSYGYAIRVACTSREMAELFTHGLPAQIADVMIEEFDPRDEPERKAYILDGSLVQLFSSPAPSPPSQDDPEKEPTLRMVRPLEERVEQKLRDGFFRKLREEDGLLGVVHVYAYLEKARPHKVRRLLPVQGGKVLSCTCEWAKHHGFCAHQGALIDTLKGGS